VIAARLDFVVMLLTLQVHQIQFIDEPKLLQQFERSIDGCPIDIRVPFARQFQERSGVPNASPRLE